MSSEPLPPPLPDLAAARTCRWLNLLVLPGLGSWLAGRRIVGTFQALLALTGFALTGFWFMRFVADCANARPSPPEGGRYLLLGLAGVGVFLFGWLWALATSLQIVRAARKTAA